MIGCCEKRRRIQEFQRPDLAEQRGWLVQNRPGKPSGGSEWVESGSSRHDGAGFVYGPAGLWRGVYRALDGESVKQLNWIKDVGKANRRFGLGRVPEHVPFAKSKVVGILSIKRTWLCLICVGHLGKANGQPG